LLADDACQRWSPGGLSSWRRPGDGGFDPSRYRVEPIADDTTAMNFILTHHYSGSKVAAVRRYGLYEQVDCGLTELVGVAVLSNPTNVKVLTNPFPDLVPYYESTELGRLVLLDRVPTNAESWFVARCFKMAYDSGIRAVVAHSDPVPRWDERGWLVMPGHWGCVYQALNMIKSGRTTRRTLAVFPDGVVLNDRTLQKIRQQEQGWQAAVKWLRARGAPPLVAGQDPARWLPEALDGGGARPARHNGCHRYLLALGPNQRVRSRVRIIGEPEPYPKQPDAVILR
jgi:hypothetical protein